MAFLYKRVSEKEGVPEAPRGLYVLLRLCEGVLTSAGRFRSAAGNISGEGSSGPVICVVLLGISGGGY